MTSAETHLAPSAMNRSSRRASYGLLIAALSAQLVLLGFSMPLAELTSGGWFFNIDNPYHIYQLELGRALQAQGHWRGYDPFFGGGHLAGLSSNVSARFTLVIAALMPSKALTTTVYATYVLMCSLIAPLATWALAQKLGWSLWHKVAALSIGLLLWWVGIFHWYHTAGMVSFVCACYLAPLYAVWTYSLCNPDTPPKPVMLLLAGLAGGAGMWLHPLFCVPVAALFFSFLLLGSGRQRLWPMLGRATAIAALAVLLCLPWVLALAQGGTQTLAGEQPYQRAVGLKVIINSLGFEAGGATGAWIDLPIAMVCLIGLLTAKGNKRSGTLPFLLAGLGLLLFAAFAGGSSSLAVLQPNRLFGPAYLLLGMAASWHLAAWVTQWNTHGRRTIKLGATALGVLVALFFGRELAREVTPGSHGHHGKTPPEISAPPPVVAALENWINANTNSGVRILFETSLGRVHGGGHIAGYLAAKTRREFMGGAYPFFSPQTSCWDKSCFGRPIGALQPEFFRRAIETYNVGWVIAHSNELKTFMKQLPEIKIAADFDGVTIFQVDGPRSFVQEGGGRVTGRDFNRIEVADASGAALTLRYHWVPRLETVPPSKIEAYQWSPDFPPLIRIVNPPASFVVRMAD